MAAPQTPKPVSQRLAASIASSVAAPASLYPILPDLFEGVESLGARPRAIASLLGSARLPSTPRILDLACGKGSVALALARAFHARVLGVDACEPFIAHAAARASRFGLINQVLFETADVHALLRTTPKPRDRFDVVIMLNLLPASAAAPLLRRWTKPGGLYLVDDAILAPRPSGASGSTDGAIGAPTLEHVSASIARLSDTVIATRVTPPATYRRLESRLRTAIDRNITRLIPRNPRLAVELRQYRRDQRDAAALLAGPLRSAMWLVRRGGQ